MPVTNVASLQKAETEIAVLQVQYENLNDKVEEVKSELKEIRQEMSNENTELKSVLQNMQDSANQAHLELHKKVSALEKWRWMLMGAGVVIGALGFETLGKLLR